MSRFFAAEFHARRNLAFAGEVVQRLPLERLPITALVFACLLALTVVALRAEIEVREQAVVQQCELTRGLPQSLTLGATAVVPGTLLQYTGPRSSWRAEVVDVLRPSHCADGAPCTVVRVQPPPLAVRSGSSTCDLPARAEVAVRIRPFVDLSSSRATGSLR